MSFPAGHVPSPNDGVEGLLSQIAGSVGAITQESDTQEVKLAKIATALDAAAQPEGTAVDATARASAAAAQATADAAQPAIDWDNRKTVYVAKGDSATDTRTGLSKYDRERPFATIQAAITAATSGDVVKVAAGDYDEAVVAANGVDMYFEPQARIVNTSALTAFSAPTGVSCIVGGHGDFITTGAEGEVPAVSFAGSGTVTFLGNLVHNQVVSNLINASGVNATKATLYLRLNAGIISDSYDGLIVADGTDVFISSPKSVGVDQGIEISGTAANVTLDIRSVSSSGSNPFTIDSSSSIRLRVLNAYIEGVTNSALYTAAGDIGSVDFVDCVFHTQDIASPISLTHTSGTVRIFGGRTWTEDQSITPVDYSITGTGAVLLVGAMLDKAINPAVTATGTYTNAAGELVVNGTTTTATGRSVMGAATMLTARANLGIQTAVTTGDQSVSSADTGTTLVTVTGLTASLTTGKSYHYRALLSAAGSGNVLTNCGIKFGVAGPTATRFRGHVQWRTNAASTLGAGAMTTAVGALGTTITSGSFDYIIIEGIYVASATGTLEIQYAQNTSHADLLTIGQGSELVVTQLN